MVWNGCCECGVGCERESLFAFFFFNDTATTEIYTLSLHDALPICGDSPRAAPGPAAAPRPGAVPFPARAEDPAATSAQIGRAHV